MKKTVLKVVTIGAVSLLAVACGPKSETKTDNTNTQTATTMETKTPYQKKYTNADFYKEGVFQGDVALKAYEEMLGHYGIKLSDFMRKNLWITDFELGDFENVGMAGFFWVNDTEHQYFAHEIYLLPGQMITEHKHVATEFPAKFESWVVKEGWCYNYCVGEETPNGPELPKCQEGFIMAKCFVKQNPGEILHLKGAETPHFMMAGPDGAIVYEFANYHDGNGLRFTNPKVQFTDVLSRKS